MKGFIYCNNYFSLIGFTSESLSIKISMSNCIIKNEDYCIDLAMLKTVKSKVKLEIVKILNDNKFDIETERRVNIIFENKEYKISVVHREEGLINQLIKFYELLEFAYENSEEVIFYNIEGLNKMEESILSEIKSKKEVDLQEFKREYKEIVNISDILIKLQRRGFILIENDKLILLNKLVKIPHF